ncbi:hypothetical protein DFH28DRAFT_465143 [Melampsora americana]|nr:hypothetical protein DFH28DRAFT_465143 [Melampsora americana]
MKLAIIWFNIMPLVFEKLSGYPLHPIQPYSLSSTNELVCPRVTEPISVIYPTSYQRCLERSKEMQLIHEQAHRDFGNLPTKEIVETESKTQENNMGYSSVKERKWIIPLIVDVLQVIKEHFIYNYFMIQGMRYLQRHL